MTFRPTTKQIITRRGTHEHASPRAHHITHASTPAHTPPRRPLPPLASAAFVCRNARPAVGSIALILSDFLDCCLPAMAQAASDDHFEFVKWFHANNLSTLAPNAVNFVAENDHLAVVLRVILSRHAICCSERTSRRRQMAA